MPVDNFKGNQVKFGEGQPTDKGGAPKGKRVSTIIKELLSNGAERFSDNESHKELDGNTALAVELITMAFDKDNKSNEKLSAIKEILDRIEGKAQQSIEVKDNTPVFKFFDARKKD